MLFIHIAAMCCLGLLLRDAPDALQKLVLATMFCGAAVLCYYYGARVFGLDCTGYLAGVAHEIEHVALLLYVFRLFVMQQERRCLPNSYRPSHSSQR